jgi:hypothetical protein
MKIYTYTINKNGSDQIKRFLSEYHKRGKYIDNQMINHWVQAAEYQLAEGNSASIEIRASDSRTGRTEIYTITMDGIDCEEVETDE